MSVLLQGGGGGFVVVTASDWAGYQTDLFGFTQLAPELRFLMVVNDNAITILSDWSAPLTSLLGSQPLSL